MGKQNDRNRPSNGKRVIEIELKIERDKEREIGFQTDRD